MGARLHHVCTFSSSVCNKKHVNRMIVRMKLVARGNESSDNPPTLNLPGCRKPLAVVCVRDRCWTPSCRWTVCTRCSNLRANLSFFFSFLFFFSPLSLTENRNSPSIFTFQFCFFFLFFFQLTRSIFHVYEGDTRKENHFIVYNITVPFFFLLQRVSLNSIRTLFDAFSYT